MGRRRKFVDFAMIVAGLGISLCRALPPDAADIFIRSLDEMTDRNVSPAEAHIFRAVVVEALRAGGAAARKPTLTLIQGGAA
jgi:hypothetical protein